MLLFAAAATPAMAQMDFAKMQTADGLAEAIKNAKHCGYNIDQAKLETYYAAAGLDDPETLSYIASSIAVGDFGGKPDASTCTMSKVTARKIGILAE